jgi:hypothetical protein
VNSAMSTMLIPLRSMPAVELAVGRRVLFLRSIYACASIIVYVSHCRNVVLMLSARTARPDLICTSRTSR